MKHLNQNTQNRMDCPIKQEHIELIIISGHLSAIFQLFLPSALGLCVTSEIAFRIVKYQAWELFANNKFEGEIVNSAL